MKKLTLFVNEKYGDQIAIGVFGKDSAVYTFPLKDENMRLIDSNGNMRNLMDEPEEVH